jgi:hypothetical protein
MGKLSALILPTNRMMMAQTLAKTGRLIKKLTNMGVGEEEKNQVGGDA